MITFDISPNMVHTMGANRVHSILIYDDPDNMNFMQVELDEYWDAIDKLDEATSREFIHGYASNITMEACIDLRNLDYTLWVLGNPQMECHL